jgi:hypothetical protein
VSVGFIICIVKKYYEQIAVKLNKTEDDIIGEIKGVFLCIRRDADSLLRDMCGMMEVGSIHLPKKIKTCEIRGRVVLWI